MLFYLLVINALITIYCPICGLVVYKCTLDLSFIHPKGMTKITYISTQIGRINLAVTFGR